MELKPTTLLIAAALMVNGCAFHSLKMDVRNAIKKEMYLNQVKLESNKLVFRTTSDTDLGVYTLETESGKTVATAELVDENRTRNSVFHAATFDIDFNDKHLGAMNSCLQIRSPSNSLVSVMTGFASTDKSFYMPVLNLNAMNIQLKELERKLATVESTIKARETLLAALKKEIAFNGNTCERPDPGPKPTGACHSRSESDSMNHEYCVAGAFKCSLGGMIAVKTASNNINIRMLKDSDVQELMTTLVQAKCSVEIDKSYNRSTDIIAMLRSYAVSKSIQAMVEATFENADADLRDSAAEYLAGILNYKLCMDDGYSACADMTRAWLFRSEQQYQQCLSAESRFENADRNAYDKRDVQLFTEEITNLKAVREKLIDEHMKAVSSRKVAEAVGCEDKDRRSFF